MTESMDLPHLLKSFIKGMEAILEMHPLAEDAAHLKQLSTTLIKIDEAIKALPQPYKEIGDSLHGILALLLKGAHSSDLQRIVVDYLHHPDATQIMLYEIQLISHELEHQPPSHRRSA